MRGKNVLALDRIYQECLDKMEKGSKKYGVFDPITDERNLLHEAEEEIQDAINYLGMFLLKLRGGTNRTQPRH